MLNNYFGGVYMENKIEFYRLERGKVLDLLRELKEELLLTKMNFLTGDICFEEFVKLRDSIKFRIDVAKEVDEEMERLLNDLMMDELARIEWAEEDDDDDDYDDYKPAW